MSSIMVACQKCGVGIEIGDMELELFRKRGQPIQASHEQCPRDKENLNQYRFVISVYKRRPEDEEDVLIAKVGDRVESDSFEAIFPALTKSINKQWEKIGERAALADQDDSPGIGPAKAQQEPDLT